MTFLHLHRLFLNTVTLTPEIPEMGRDWKPWVDMTFEGTAFNLLQVLILWIPFEGV
jgi:hypothetical protein